MLCVLFLDLLIFISVYLFHMLFNSFILLQ
nr:MAG TPA: hypothetical protein [Caudoviricetes sp.]